MPFRSLKSLPKRRSGSFRSQCIPPCVQVRVSDNETVTATVPSTRQLRLRYFLTSGIVLLLGRELEYRDQCGSSITQSASAAVAIVPAAARPIIVHQELT